MDQKKIVTNFHQNAVTHDVSLSTEAEDQKRERCLVKKLPLGDHHQDMQYLDDYDLAKPVEIVHQGEDTKCKKTQAQEQAHWRSVDGVAAAAQGMKTFCTTAAAAQGMKKFCTKALIPKGEQKQHMAVRTIFCRPELLQDQVAAVDPTSLENPLPAPIRQQMNLKRNDKLGFSLHL